MQFIIDLEIPDNVWKEKRPVVATSIDGLGDKLKPELHAAWLAYISETYPYGPVAEADIIGDSMLEIDDWVPDAVFLLYARWSPATVVDVPIGKLFCNEYVPKCRVRFMKQ